MRVFLIRGGSDYAGFSPWGTHRKAFSTKDSNPPSRTPKSGIRNSLFVWRWVPSQASMQSLRVAHTLGPSVLGCVSAPVLGSPPPSGKHHRDRWGFGSHPLGLEHSIDIVSGDFADLGRVLCQGVDVSSIGPHRAQKDGSN